MCALTYKQEKDITKIVEIDGDYGDWDFSLKLLEALLAEIPFEDLDMEEYADKYRALLQKALKRIPPLPS